MVLWSPVRWLTVTPPSTRGTNWLRSRMLANVPRIITSWLPRRDPYELKSRFSTPCDARYAPAGESGLIEPAGEMWSVVTESPSFASTRAPSMSETGSGDAAIPSKYGLPDSTLTTARSYSLTAAEISSGSGPELPMQVVQPYPTRLKPSLSRYGVSPARS